MMKPYKLRGCPGVVTKRRRFLRASALLALGHWPLGVAGAVIDKLGQRTDEYTASEPLDEAFQRASPPLPVIGVGTQGAAMVRAMRWQAIEDAWFLAFDDPATLARELSGHPESSLVEGTSIASLISRCSDAGLVILIVDADEYSRQRFDADPLMRSVVTLHENGCQCMALALGDNPLHPLNKWGAMVFEIPSCSLNGVLSRDAILRQTVISLAGLHSGKSLIGVDLADVFDVIGRSRFGMAAVGRARGEGRANRAVNDALRQIHRHARSVRDVVGVIATVIANEFMSADEMLGACFALADGVPMDATVLVGAINDPDVPDDEIMIRVVSTYCTETGAV